MKPLLPLDELQKRLKNYLIQTGQLSVLIPSNARLLELKPPERIQSGMSNKVFFFDIFYTISGRDVRKSVVLRLYPEKTDGSKAEKEFYKLKRLVSAPVPTPKPYILELKSNILDYPFTIIERIPGINLEQAIENYQPEDFQKFMAGFSQYLVNLHNYRSKNFGVEDRKGGIKEELPYDKYILGDINRSLEFLREAGYYVEPLSKWFFSFKKDLKLKRFSLLHGDPQPRNIMVQGAKVTGLIDWEYSRLGDPALDAGWTLFFFSLYPKLDDYRQTFFSNYYSKVKLPEIDRRIFFYEVYSATRMMAFAVSARDHFSEKFRESGEFLGKIQEAFFKYEEKVRTQSYGNY
ncbi:MAG: aminoglycoside phosphotransferase family protein [Asgard group archaeon]|nr:aminoglycoside phosphotransferase family protein [Asgard group archaeon]